MLLWEFMCYEELWSWDESLQGFCKQYIPFNPWKFIFHFMKAPKWDHETLFKKRIVLVPSFEVNLIFYNHQVLVTSLCTQHRESKQFCNYVLQCVVILRKLENNKLLRNAGEKGLLQTSLIIPDASEHWSLQGVSCAENLGDLSFILYIISYTVIRLYFISISQFLRNHFSML